MESDILELLTVNNPTEDVFLAPGVKKIKVKTTKAFDPPESVLEKIEEVWEEEKAKTPHITNGTVVGYVYGVDVYGIAEIGVAPVQFKHFLTSKFDRVPGYKQYAVGEGAVTKIRFKGDSYVLFAERGKKTGYDGGSIEIIPQGLMDLKDIEVDDASEASVAREYREEIAGFPMPQTQKYLGIALNPWGLNVSPSYLFETDCRNSHDFIEENSKKGFLKIRTPDRDETKRRFAVSIDVIEEYLTEVSKDVTWNSRARLRMAFNQGYI